MINCRSATPVYGNATNEARHLKYEQNASTRHQVVRPDEKNDAA
jgi:hypothetical protein